MNPPSIDIKDLLNGDTSLGLTFQTDLHVSYLPDDDDTPNLCVAVFDTPGESPEHGVDADSPAENPGVMVMVRGNIREYSEAYMLANDIKNFLKGESNHNFTLNGTKYVGIWSEGNPIPIGYDDEGRPLFTINFRIKRSG